MTHAYPYLNLHNNCYFIHPENATWFDARYKCMQCGAELFQEDDHDRFLGIKNGFQSQGNQSEHRSFWIGAMYGHWEWSTASKQHNNCNHHQHL